MNYICGVNMTDLKPTKMKATDLKAGMKINFTPTNHIFEIAKVTETRVSWYTRHEFKSSWGRNTMKMAWVTLKAFQRGIDNGAYKLAE